MQFEVQKVRLAVALAIVRSKPAHLSVDEYLSHYKKVLLEETLEEEDEEGEQEEQQEERELLASMLRHVSTTVTTDAIEEKARVMEKAVALAQRWKRKLHELRMDNESLQKRAKCLQDAAMAQGGPAEDDQLKVLVQAMDRQVFQSNIQATVRHKNLLRGAPNMVDCLALLKACARTKDEVLLRELGTEVVKQTSGLICGILYQDDERGRTPGTVEVITAYEKVISRLLVMTKDVTASWMVDIYPYFCQVIRWIPYRATVIAHQLLQEEIDSTDTSDETVLLVVRALTHFTTIRPELCLLLARSCLESLLLLLHPMEYQQRLMEEAKDLAFLEPTWERQECWLESTSSVFQLLEGCLLRYPSSRNDNDINMQILRDTTFQIALRDLWKEALVQVPSNQMLFLNRLWMLNKMCLAALKDPEERERFQQMLFQQ